MDLRLDSDVLLRFFLMGTRLSGLFVLSPVLGLNSVPIRVRLIFVLLLSLIFTAALPADALPINTTVELVRAMVEEFLIGALLGLGVQAVFAAFSMAGHLLDYQVGFNAAALFDRNTQAQSPVLSVFLGMLGGVMFLALDGHHLLLRAVGQTLQTFPVGREAFVVSTAVLAKEFGLVFLFGLTLAAPTAIGLFLLDAATAFVSRTMPQLNVYFVSLPLKIFWGLLILTVTVTHAGPVMQRLFTESIAASLGR